MYNVGPFVLSWAQWRSLDPLACGGVAQVYKLKREIHFFKETFIILRVRLYPKILSNSGLIHILCRHIQCTEDIWGGGGGGGHAPWIRLSNHKMTVYATLDLQQCRYARKRKATKCILNSCQTTLSFSFRVIKQAEWNIIVDCWFRWSLEKCWLTCISLVYRESLEINVYRLHLYMKPVIYRIHTPYGERGGGGGG